jgi:predicted nuclease of predicted toxin-antitoxin system
MKFLVDECVDHRVVDWLRNQSHDVASIIEVSSGISDNQVLDKAFSENRILVTMDKDFGDIVFRGNQDHSGIILLRASSWEIEGVTALLNNVLVQHSHELDNNFIVATEQSIRIVHMGTRH